jgi:glycosyltransferase involved in cell wall biosynthesis
MVAVDTLPKVSIIIPVYNGANYLNESIKSALAQTYQNLEVVVVNDGSNDRGATERVAQSFGDKIRYFHKENGGVASALNFGIQKMTGRYFSWLSHDDLYEKTKIEDQVSMAVSLQSDNTIIACNARVLFESGIKKSGPINKNVFKYFDIFLAVSAGVGLNGCSLLIPKKALIESGGFNPDLPVTQDYDLWFRLYHKYNYKFVLLDKDLVIYRRHEEQDSVKKQDLSLTAGDDLHYNILETVTYDQFKAFLQDHKSNLKYTLDSYRLYKERGYAKTRSAILKYILNYLYDTDLEKFYKVFCSEMDTDKIFNAVKLQGGSRGQLKLTDTIRKMIVQEYQRLIQVDPNRYPVKAYVTDHVQPSGKIRGAALRFGESVKQDGLYLTGEKLIRKVHKKIKRSK